TTEFERLNKRYERGPLSADKVGRPGQLDDPVVAADAGHDEEHPLGRLGARLWPGEVEEHALMLAGGRHGLRSNFLLVRQLGEADLAAPAVHVIEQGAHVAGGQLADDRLGM